MNAAAHPVRTLVVKYGGHAMADAGLRESFAADVVTLHRSGTRVVVVHGGGPQIDAHLDRLGIAPVFRGGLRVTTPEVMQVVRMVLAGQVQRDIVGLINAHAPLAVGITGEDAGLFRAAPRRSAVDGAAVDLGLVGDITSVSPGIVHDLLAAGRIPVVTGIAVGADGVYNINADSAAAALAPAVGADDLVLLTDVPGLYVDWPPGPASRVAARLTVAEVQRLLPALDAGMAPKMEACVRAVRGGVPRARVVDGRQRHVLLADPAADEAVGGTTVVAA